jgi:hypothetical protein
MAAFGASNVLVRGRSRRGLALAVAAATPVLLTLLCDATGNEDLEGYVGLLAVAEVIGVFFLPAIAPNGFGFVNGERHGPLRADREGIGFRGRSLLSRAQIRHVAVEGLIGGRQIVHVSTLRPKDDVHIELEDDERARALVAALDLDPEKHVATFSVDEDPLRSRARWLAARVMIAAGALLIAAAVLYLARRNDFFLFALVPALLGYSLLLPRARARTDIALAADGLTLRHRGRQRSIPLSTIAEPTVSGNTATLVLTSGETLDLRFGGDNDETAALHHAAFMARLRQALGRRHRLPIADPGEAMLTKGEQATSDWAKHLSTLARAEEGYRVATVPPDTLWRIAEGVSAEPSARVGALVALHARLDDDARVRLQDLATRTAQRDLRAALEAAASGADPEEILAAYERTRS